MKTFQVLGPGYRNIFTLEHLREVEHLMEQQRVPRLHSLLVLWQALPLTLLPIVHGVKSAKWLHEAQSFLAQGLCRWHRIWYFPESVLG